MLRTAIPLFLACAMLAGIPAAIAQSDQGSPSYEATLPISAYEYVNMGNLNINVHVPIRAKGGPVPLSLGASVNVQLFNSTGASGTFASTAHAGFQERRNYWNGALNTTNIGGQVACNGNITQKYVINAIIMDDGTQHPFSGGADWDTAGECFSPYTVFTSCI
jgi:hypothetical protein